VFMVGHRPHQAPRPQPLHPQRANGRTADASPELIESAVLRLLPLGIGAVWHTVT